MSKNVIKELGTLKEFRGSETDAEQAKREHAELAANLKSKQITVKGELTPEHVRQTGPPEGAQLKGGPFEGLQASVPRGIQEFTRPAPNSDSNGNSFVPAIYRRTKDRTKDGLTIFQFVEAAA